MLVRARLKNFQLVKSLDLRFDAVTAFVGESQKGKSCIFRSLEALLNNARGSKFITHGENECAVMWQSRRGAVEWIKSAKGSASYVVGGDPDHDHKFKDQKCSCGADRYEKVEQCPKQVYDMLGIAPIKFGDDLELTVNVAGQLQPDSEGPNFLVFDTGTTVAKVLGKFTRLDEVYQAVRAANKDLGDLKSDQKVRQADLEAADKRLALHDGVEDLEPLLGALERSAQGIDAKQKEVEALAAKIQELKAVQVKIANLKLDGIEPLHGWPVPGLQEKVNQILSLEKLLKDCKTAYERVEYYHGKVERQEEVLSEKRMALAEFKAVNKLCPGCGKPWSS